MGRQNLLVHVYLENISSDMMRNAKIFTFSKNYFVLPNVLGRCSFYNQIIANSCNSDDFAQKIRN
jgi:hypothetical protein